MPGVLDTPIFDLESTYVVDFGDAPPSNEGLRVRKGAVTFDLTVDGYELVGASTDGRR